MKITKSQLTQIIKEELKSIIEMHNKDFFENDEDLDALSHLAGDNSSVQWFTDLETRVNNARDAGLITDQDAKDIVAAAKGPKDRALKKAIGYQ